MVMVMGYGLSNLQMPLQASAVRAAQAAQETKIQGADGWMG